MLTTADLNIWTTQTRAAKRGLVRPFRIRTIGTLLREAIAANNNQLYLDRLRTLLERILLLSDDDRQTYGAALGRLEPLVREDLKAAGNNAVMNYRRDTLVLIDDWLDQYLPDPIAPGSIPTYNIVGEDARLRTLRRSCVRNELIFQYKCADRASLAQLDSLTRSYMSPNGHWSPGSRCHFVAQLLGATKTAFVADPQGKSRQQKIDDYCSAVFHNVAGQGVARISHSFSREAGVVTDATWNQFFPETVEDANKPAIFEGTEAQFRQMMG